MKNLKLIIIAVILFAFINVNAKGSIEISEKNINILSGDTKSIEIIASDCAGRVDISSSDPSVVSVNQKDYFFDTSLDDAKATIEITAIKEGTAFIEVKLSDVANFDYEELSGTITCQVNVIPKPEKIDISGINRIIVGDNTTLSSSVLPEHAGEEVEWISDNPSIATVSSDGVVKGLKAGKVIITARSIYDENIQSKFEIEIINNEIADVPKTSIDTNYIVYIIAIVLVVIAGVLFYYFYRLRKR